MPRVANKFIAGFGFLTSALTTSYANGRELLCPENHANYIPTRTFQGPPAMALAKQSRTADIASQTVGRIAFTYKKFCYYDNGDPSNVFSSFITNGAGVLVYGSVVAFAAHEIPSSDNQTYFEMTFAGRISFRQKPSTVHGHVVAFDPETDRAYGVLDAMPEDLARQGIRSLWSLGAITTVAPPTPYSVNFLGYADTGKGYLVHTVGQITDSSSVPMAIIVGDAPDPAHPVYPVKIFECLEKAHGQIGPGASGGASIEERQGIFVGLNQSADPQAQIVNIIPAAAVLNGFRDVFPYFAHQMGLPKIPVSKNCARDMGYSGGLIIEPVLPDLVP
jgi:hypothetical protein